MFLCVCTVTDFSADDKASGVKFGTAVRRRPRQGIRSVVLGWGSTAWSKFNYVLKDYSRTGFGVS